MPSGAKIYCMVNQFQSVLARMENMDVRPYHIFASAACRDHVVQTVERLPRSLKVRVKEVKMVSMVPVGSASESAHGITKCMPVGDGKQLTTSSTDSTSEGSCPEMSTTSSAFDQSVPPFNLFPQETMPFSLFTDIFMRESGLLDWASLESNLEAIAMEWPDQTFPACAEDRLEWERAEHREILESWSYATA
jgi:hypothetical protein